MGENPELLAPSTFSFPVSSLFPFPGQPNSFLLVSERKQKKTKPPQQPKTKQNKTKQSFNLIKIGGSLLKTLCCVSHLNALQDHVSVAFSVSFPHSCFSCVLDLFVLDPLRFSPARRVAHMLGEVSMNPRADLPEQLRARWARCA